ncbi:GLPGLI family protein [Chryseobacterium zhengzhouense]|uniref:GLPGLI family protein n=1 Tax=Chryseobacterium zhengzhouense TaxID=1636086 RepID=A0ABW2M1N4_9FLAO
MLQNIKITLLVFITSIMPAQHLKVEYENINKSFASAKDVSESEKKALDEFGKPQKEILFYANGNSFYTNLPPKAIVNQKEKVKIDDKVTKVASEVFIVAKTKIYHNKDKEGLYQYKEFRGDEFYHYAKPKYKSIDYKEETEMIQSFLCKLVEVTFESGQLVKVWYTEDVPVSTGPYAYIDFPGLVLKVESDNFLIYATKVSNEATEKDVEKINPNFTVYEGADYSKKMQEVNEQAKTPLKREIRL